MAKNQVDRALRALLDPPPSGREVDDLWEHFGSRCAYCRKALCRERREGHLDHARCASDGGGNSIHNRVLACGACNGDEKREEHWQSFLRGKHPSEAQFSERRQHIERWLGPDPVERLSPIQRLALTEILAEARASIDSFAIRIRALRS